MRGPITEAETVAREGELDMQRLSGFGGKGLMANAIGRYKEQLLNSYASYRQRSWTLSLLGSAPLHQKLRLEVTPTPGRI